MNTHFYPACIECIIWYVDVTECLSLSLRIFSQVLQVHVWFKWCLWWERADMSSWRL